MKTLVSILASATLVLATASFAQTAEVVDLPTRPGVRQRMLVVQPEHPTAVLLLMTGGNGQVGIYDNGSLRADGNFLVRSRTLFVQRGFAVVLLDPPSDHDTAPFLAGTFRESPEHAADIGAAVAWSRSKWSLPVWLVGTSRGTQSVASAGILLTGASAPDGLVLTSTILGASRVGQSRVRPVQEMSLEKLRMPVLVTHHEQDQCQVTPPALVPALMEKLTPATSRLLTYTGGRSTGNVCEAFAYHGYNGIEDRVVADIAAFVTAPPKAGPP